MTPIPVPYSKPIVPVLVYHSQSPPVRPDVADIPDDIIIARDFIATQIANLAGLYSTRNKARMFCYNMIAYGHFDNIHFQSIYRYVCGLLLFKHRRRHLLDIRLSTIECVHQVLTMYTAFLCNNYPEVMNTLTKEQIEENKRQSLMFEDVKAMAESTFQQCRTESQQRQVDRARDIIYKCKDIYTLTPSDLEQDCKKVFAVSQQRPLTPRDFIKQTNPLEIKPEIPPVHYEPEAVMNIEPHSHHPPARGPIDHNGFNKATGFPKKRPMSPVADYNQPFHVQNPNAIVQPHQTLYPPQQPGSTFTSQESQIYSPPPVIDRTLPRYPDGLIPEHAQSSFQQRYGEFMNTAPGYQPQQGYHPQQPPSGWQPQMPQQPPHGYHPPAAYPNTPLGQPGPNGLIQQPPLSNYRPMVNPQQPQQGYQPQMPQQGYQPQQPLQGYQPQQPPQGYQPPQAYQPQQGFQPQGYQPPQAYQLQHPQMPQQGYQPQQPTNGYYLPEVAVVQILGYLPNGDRDVIGQDGYRYRQQYIQGTNFNSAIGQSGNRSMFVQNAAADQSYANADLASMNRWTKRQQFINDEKERTQQAAQPQQPVRPTQPQGYQPQKAPQSPVQPTQHQPATQHQPQPQVAPQQPVRKPEWDPATSSQFRKVLDNRQYFEQDEEDRLANEWAQMLRDGVESQFIEPDPTVKMPYEDLDYPNTNKPVRPAVRMAEENRNIVVRSRRTHPESFIKLVPVMMGGETEMDRSQHLISHFGGAMRYSLDTKMKEFKQNVATIMAAPAVKMADIKTKEEIKDPETEEVVVVEVDKPAMDDVDYIIYPNTLGEKSFEDALLGSQLLKLEHTLSNPEDKIFRTFGIISQMFVSNADIDPVLAELRSCTNLVSLATALRKATLQSYRSIKDKESIINVLLEVDRMITTHVNEFLKFKLSIPATIAETLDVLELREFLVEHYGNPKMGEAFDRFEAEFMDSINTGLDAPSLDDMSVKAGIPDDVGMSYLSATSSFTHISLTAIDLALDIDLEGQYSYINPEMHPLLYQLAANLDDNKHKRKFTTLNDYIVTADNVCYRVFNNYIDEDIFIITKA